MIQRTDPTPLTNGLRRIQKLTAIEYVLDSVQDFKKQYAIYRSNEHARTKVKVVEDFIRDLKLKYWILCDDLKAQAHLTGTSLDPQHGDIFMDLKAQENILAYPVTTMPSGSLTDLFAMDRLVMLCETLELRQHETMSALGIATPIQNIFSVPHRVAAMNSESVTMAALQASIPLNSHDYLGRTALHVAAEKDFSSTALVLIQGGIDLECKDVFERSALLIALQNGSYNTATLLLEHEVDVEASDLFGHTPLHQAVLNL